MLACEANCNTCSSPTVCTVCTSPYRRYQSNCYNPCPTGTFASSASQCTGNHVKFERSTPHSFSFIHSFLSLACEANCNVCSSATACTTCASPYRRYQGNCYNPCPSGTFAS